MEEAGAQVALPIFMHGALSSRFCESPLMARKRDYPHSQVQPLNYQAQDLQHPSDPRANWNLNSWDWDSVRFVAKPVESEILRLGSVTAEQKKREGAAANGVPGMLKKGAARDEDDESLKLNLGGGLKSLEEPVPRPNKRVRSGSPGSNYPMCQVDDCSEDLSSAKDYHRRHKVCEGHSKVAKALVGKQMQRFCQQCSRFHPLSEFDEGKRSCRRRLAGHNRRRRKTQAEDASSRVLSPGAKDTSADANLDIVNLLTAFARAQGKIEDKSINSSPVPDREQILQILNKINALALPTDLAAKLASFRNLNGAASGQAPSDHLTKFSGAISSPSTMDLLTVLSATLLSQKNGQITESEKSKVANFSDQSADPKPMVEINSVGGERSSSSYHSPNEDSDCHVLETRTNLPLQLFSSSPENCSLPKLPASRKYFSSGSSNRTEDRSPSSSPVVQRLFPLQSSVEEAIRPETSVIREVNGNAEMNRERAHIAPLELFRDYDKGPGRGLSQGSPYQTGYTSSSGSDHSPSSLSLDTQERTVRIMFKLFDKDPSHLPGDLRSQIYNWLSNSPLEMESYIRPGCLVLSIYLSMPCAAWEQLQENLLERLHTLLQGSESSFWKNGRFLVHTGRKFASHNDGKIHLIKSWRTSSPELILVSPLALAVGEEIAQLVLQGRNLVDPGTKIHCTYMGGYMSKEIAELTCEKSTCDEIRITGFEIGDGVAAPPSLGRCFIEVENGLKGNSFPLIIADATICSELRTLESELMERKNSSREEVLHFLNELGWLFQRRKDSSTPPDPNHSIRRFKFLVTFSVERDWCYLVKKLLDIFVESNLDESIPTKESLEALSEVQLLNRAVRRGCTKMVELLINYAVNHGPDASRTYIFLPNMVGPGGITPLHLAACTSGSTNVIEALTNDPQEIGLNSWSTLLDASGQSPHSYAAMRNNHSYNELVARKLSNRRDGQISLTIRGFEIVEQENAGGPQSVRQRVSCGRCSVVAMRPYGTTIKKGPGVLHRPYIHSMLVIAAVCVCVCLFLRGAPKVGLVAPFKWENLDYGPL
ncbi:squamosa promoter-binding-like protein 14 [Punica granatum]|uniref:Squamosa promoter-binding-like protein 14 n=2 Tax=Punica granatum TaxID=22663 RepID=A0A6P8EDS5_PUNGR|nr:squamosa promoter-binding-like protein 14 [Punica granatum]XP_031403493.1 squamosa promoter-binding-like protein 14 [Punica granatum]OWM85979.1 hypothetical protein CDL15_Pgr012229 [Punica granatum]PKI35748.1 hypothetical protein CRG98_043906 [Punica granatum]